MIVQGYSPINEARATNKRDPKKFLMDSASKEGFSVRIDPRMITLKKNTKISEFTITYYNSGTDELNWTLATSGREMENTKDDFLDYVNNYKSALRLIKSCKLILNIDDIIEEAKNNMIGTV